MDMFAEERSFLLVNMERMTNRFPRIPGKAPREYIVTSIIDDQKLYFNTLEDYLTSVVKTLHNYGCILNVPCIGTVLIHIIFIYTTDKS